MWSWILWWLSACSFGQTPECRAVVDAPAVRLQGAGSATVTPVAAACGEVVDIQFAPDGTLLIVDQAGAVRWVSDTASGQWLSVPVATGNERGLLGLALHPRFSENRRFFLNYTSKRGGTLSSVVEEWQAGEGAWTSGAKPVRVVYQVAQPFGNHNGGDLAFGPDGMLYIGFGDGGKWGDPHGHGPNKKTALGSMLRIDIDGGVPYGVPADNPFVGRRDALPEVWAYGLRNPWRYAFDPKGRLIAGDVGQNKWEEITYVVAGGDHGWNALEGRHCYARSPCSLAGTITPIWTYGRDVGQSVTGGVVALQGPWKGQYVFGDYLSGRIWVLPLPEVGETAEPVLLGLFDGRISTFGRDGDGRVYLADWTGGRVYRLDPG